MPESHQEDEQHTSLTKEKVRLMIKNQALETENKVSEARLKFVLFLGAAFLTVFGVIVPMLLTNTSSEKVDRAIKDMEAKFEKLAGEQLRKANIECFLEGKPLEGAVLKLSLDRKSAIVVRNTGDREARWVMVDLYTKNDLQNVIGSGFQKKPLSDIPGYDHYYQHDAVNWDVSFVRLHPRATALIEFKKGPGALPRLETEAILKVHFGEPEPKVFRFTIKVGN